MADIKVVIQLQDTIEDVIEKLGSSAEVNNASIQKINGNFNILSTSNNGANLKSWANVIKDSDGNIISKVVNGETISQGLLSLADGYVGGANTQLIEQYGYNGYVFGAVPENKKLTVTLEVRGKNIDSIIIYGDKNANQFPTKAYRDGDTTDIIYSDDPTWAVKFDNVESSHTITFLEWNRENYNACITYVAELKNKLYLDKSWLKSVESLSQSTGQPKDIYYGVTPSSGNIELIDINGELYDYINDKIIPNNPTLDILVDNNLIMKHLQENSNYSYKNTGGYLSLDLTDISSLLSLRKNIEMPLKNSSNALLIFQYILRQMGYNSSQIENITEQKIIITDYIGEEYQDKEVTIYEFLKYIDIPYPYLESSNYLEIFNKFCKLLQVNMINSNINGEIFIPKVITSRPRVMSDETPIFIPLKNQFSLFDYSLFPKNVINSVNVIYREIHYEFEQINNKKVSLYDYSVSDNTLLATDVLSDSERNPDIVILYENLKDYNSSMNASNYDNNFFSIIKYNVASFVNYENPKFQFTGNGNLVDIDILNDVKNGSDNRVVKEDAINVYTSEVGDNYIIQNWTNGAYIYQEYADKFVNCAIRNNGDSLDVFVCFINKRMKQGTSQNEMVVTDFNFSLDMRRLSYTDVNNNENSDLDISSNELIQDGTKYGTNKIYDLLEASIKRDYKKGISTGNITISCNDYYDIYGNIVKDFSKGEIILVGDVLKVEGNDKLWRVTGRNFRKTGVPMVDLELQEVIV